jgi:hypothetical protein
MIGYCPIPIAELIAELYFRASHYIRRYSYGNGLSGGVCRMRLNHFRAYWLRLNHKAAWNRLATLIFRNRL